MSTGLAGAALRQKNDAPRAAATMGSSGISSWHSTAPPTCRSARLVFAPEATTMVVSPPASTVISATPVGSALACNSRSTSDSRSPAVASSAAGSSPTLPIIRTSAPSLAAATAWFAPLPPGYRANVAPVIVSPGRGRRSALATRSRLIDPTTVSLGLGGKRAQVFQRPAEQVLAQVEEPGPERRAIRRPIHQLGGARLAVPRATLRLIRLELEEVATERPLEADERRLHPLGSAPKRSLPPSGGCRLGLSPRPALQEPAERERRHLARNELADQVPCCRLLGRAVDERLGPAGRRIDPESAHTSTMTGRIKGRLPVLS